jgi:glycosidase
MAVDYPERVAAIVAGTLDKSGSGCRQVMQWDSTGIMAGRCLYARRDLRCRAAFQSVCSCCPPGL